jgi:hypothetical protein
LYENNALFLSTKTPQAMNTSENRSRKLKGLALLVLMVAALIVSSCKSQESCAAYGEAKNYQIEKKH